VTSELDRQRDRAAAHPGQQRRPDRSRTGRVNLFVAATRPKPYPGDLRAAARAVDAAVNRAESAIRAKSGQELGDTL
jgi:hypothetical protein